MTTRRIGLVGDFNPAIPAHQAIPMALQLASNALDVDLDHDWLPTEEITHTNRLSRYDALWCVPGSPYRSMDGALSAIRFARENKRPFLGTCGGFQHAVIEYARNVLGWADADHAETSTDSLRLVITPLACALIESTGPVRFERGSRIATAYGVNEAGEGYHCSYGIDAEYQAELMSGPLQITARDEDDEVRAIELEGHPFFVATLFQPERAALRGRLPPLVAAFVRAIDRQARSR